MPAFAQVAVPMMRATPSRYLDGRPAYQKDMKLCWSADRGRVSCGNTDIDLGAGSPLFDPTALPGAPVTDHVVLTPGTRLRATTRSGRAIWGYTAATSVMSNMTLLVAQGYTQFNTGIHFFFDRVGAREAHSAPRGGLASWGGPTALIRRSSWTALTAEQLAPP